MVPFFFSSLVLPLSNGLFDSVLNNWLEKAAGFVTVILYKTGLIFR